MPDRFRSMMLPATNVLIEGSIDNDRVTLTNLGADIARGTLTGNRSVTPTAAGKWKICTWRISVYKSEKSLTNLFTYAIVPSLQNHKLR